MKIEIEDSEIRKLLNEAAEMREQLARLQAEGTRLVESQRRSSITVQVSEFHHKFGYPVRYAPSNASEVTEDEVRFRVALIMEEAFEVAEAIFGAALYPAWNTMKMLISSASVRFGDNLAEIADGLADLDYVVEGTRLTFGIPRVPVALEVQRANMEKERAPGNSPNAPAKAVKPEGWKPPDIERVLRESE